MRCLRIAFAYELARPSAMAVTNVVVPARSCSRCGARLTANQEHLCDGCEGARLHAAAERVLASVVGVSDEGEFLRAGDEP